MNETNSNAPVQNANPADPTTVQPPSSPPQPSPVNPRDYRYTAQDVAEGIAQDWMVGRTPSEAARMMSQFVTHATPVDNNRGVQYAPQPQAGAGEPDPNLMYSDPAAYQRQLNAYNQQMMRDSLAQVTAPLFQQNAQTALSLAKRGRYSDVWKRFEPEILMELQGIQPSMYNESLLDKAAEIVQGRHWRDFVNDEVQKQIASGGVGTERGSQGGSPAPGGSHRDALDEAWDSNHPYFERAKEARLSKSDMREHIRTRIKIPVDQFVKNIQDEQVIVTERGFTRSSF